MKKVEEIEIKEKLEEFKRLLSDVGWDMKILAKKLAQINHETDEYKEYEKIKKLNSRLPKTTKKLDFYINFIINHRDSKKYNFLKLPEVDFSHFNHDERNLLKEIREISKDFFDERK